MSGGDSQFQASAFGVDTEEIDRLIEADRLESLYAATPKSLLGGVACAAVMAAAYAPQAGAGLAWGWCALKLLVIGLRFQDWRRFSVTPQRRSRITHWHWRHATGSLVDGLSWGLSAWLFMPSGNDLLDGLLGAGLVGVASVGVFTLSSHYGDAVRFMAASLLPWVAHELLLQRGSASWVVAAGVSIYLVVLAIETWQVWRHQTELLRLRFENAAIASDREQALRRVEEASQAKSRFLATVSHELRTPLNGIMGMAELIAQDQAPRPQAERLAVVRQSASHLLSLIDDLLDVSRIEFGRFELHPEPTALRPLLHGVTDLLTPLAEARGLRFSVEVEPQVPEAALLDAPRVRQVLHNLLGNALKFTEQGDIGVRLERRGELLQFTVRDSGRGIPPAMLERIFDAFERGEQDRQTSGTGLGLTISRRLARAMGGNLTAHGRADAAAGAVFVFTVGCREARLTAPASVPRVTPAADDPLGGEILLVEDNPVNALVARGMLEQLGLQVREAADGAQALAELARARPQLVLMDCQMPVLDGWEATRRWRRLEQQRGLPRLPVIALTANAVAGDRDGCLAAGMDDYLTKPITQAALAAMLRQYLAPKPAPR